MSYDTDITRQMTSKFCSMDKLDDAIKTLNYVVTYAWKPCPVLNVCKLLCMYVCMCVRVHTHTHTHTHDPLILTIYTALRCNLCNMVGFQSLNWNQHRQYSNIPLWFGVRVSRKGKRTNIQYDIALGALSIKWFVFLLSKLLPLYPRTRRWRGPWYHCFIIVLFNWSCYQHEYPIQPE